MIHRGNAARLPAVALLSAVLLAGSLLVFHMSAMAEGARHCARFAKAADLRAAEDAGAGAPVVVIGDSYSVGLGLDRPAHSWPVELDGRVHVAGFSGSGFSEGASGCGEVAFADRAAEAVNRNPALVVVEGGLNDFDQPSADITAGFVRMMRALEGQRVVVVGPVLAPARSTAVPRVDQLLAGLSAEHGAAYIRTTGLDLDYLQDRLHLTEAGHRDLGSYVADRLVGLS
ncbi:MAG TPA: SGNH/GDSL hydrolase family protein [Nocardioides sp.]|nr:SGNH/GDSL hydrolase family protein [Nocardioides sp.]